MFCSNCWSILYKHLLDNGSSLGPWWWSSGQRARIATLTIRVWIPLKSTVSFCTLFQRAKRGRGWPIKNNGPSSELCTVMSFYRVNVWRKHFNIFMHLMSHVFMLLKLQRKVFPEPAASHSSKFGLFERRTLSSVRPDVEVRKLPNCFQK